jgi:predicted peptidase
MMLRISVLFLVAIVLLSCSDDEASIVKAIKPKGAPAWKAGYPTIAFGAVSMDINIQCDRSAKIHYIVATSDLNLTAKEVIQYSKTPNTIEIRYAGTFDAFSGKETRKTLTGLTQNEEYFTYLVAQNTSDTVYQKDVETADFKTYYRQDTSEFHSDAEDRTVTYLIYRPEEILKYPGKTYPICHFLASELELPTEKKTINLFRNGSIPEYLNKGNDVAMMVMSIQPEQEEWNTALIDEGIEHANATYPVNQKKIYLTGMSNGAFGCWDYSVEHPDKLTAIVPISGGGQTSKACTLNDTNVWAFHNQKDNSVSASKTTSMILAIQACPANEEVKQLLFPDSGHDCWRRVYDQEHSDWSKSPGTERIDIYAWMLSKSK